MAFQDTTICSTKICFDKEKTAESFYACFKRCDCRFCNNYYAYISTKSSLIDFLADFGVDAHMAKEVCTYEPLEGLGSVISTAYYPVYGQVLINGGVCKLFGFDVSFREEADNNNVFYIVVESNLSFH